MSVDQMIRNFDASFVEFKQAQTIRQGVFVSVEDAKAILAFVDSSCCSPGDALDAFARLEVGIEPKAMIEAHDDLRSIYGFWRELRYRLLGAP